MKNEIYGSGNYQDFCNDSSNHAKEGEGVPEMLQRMSKDRNLEMIDRMNKDTEAKIVLAIGIPVIPETDNFAKHIAKKMLNGEL